MEHAQAKNAKKLIKGHSFDYDIFLELNNKNSNLNLKPYAVFLDQCLPFHPAVTYRGENQKVTKEKYFPALNDFFKSFENKTGLEIIFAAHPRSRYDLYPEFLYGRKYFINKTSELVKNSKLVLLHTTTSISYAVLYNKPIIFITTDEYIKSFDDFRMHSYSRSLNSLLFNIDDKNNYSKIPKNDKIYSFDKAKYEEYKNNYVKFPGTPDKNLGYIFLDSIVDES